MNNLLSINNPSNPAIYQTPNLDTSWEQLQKIVQEQADLIRSLQAKSCQCHIIDPSKIRVLLWINRTKEGKPETATLKIGEQRLLGLPRSDRRGEGYFRFDEIIEKASAEQEVKCSNCLKEVKVTKIPCWECKVEMKIAGELDESKPLVCENCLKKKTQAQKEANQKVESQKEPKTQRQELKEQIQQTIQENQAVKNNHETADNKPS